MYMYSTCMCACILVYKYMYMYIYMCVHVHGVHLHVLVYSMSACHMCQVRDKMLYAATKATVKKAFQSGLVVDDIYATTKVQCIHVHVHTHVCVPPYMYTCTCTCVYTQFGVWCLWWFHYPGLLLYTELMVSLFIRCTMRCEIFGPSQLSCLGSSAGRALCLEYRVSWVRVPPEAAHFF